MKQLVLGVVVLWSLFPAHSSAQHGGGGRGGFSGGAGPGRGFRGGHFGSPPSRPVPPFRSTENSNRFGRYGYGWGGGLGWAFPDNFGDYGDVGYPDNGYQGPVILMPQQESCPTVIQPPPPPIESALREYTWPESGSDPSAVFAIISKDGIVRPAVAVWVQGDTVHYVTPEDHDGRLALDSIDRAATRSANAAKHLMLALPATSSLR